MRKIILLTSLFVGFASFAGNTRVNGYIRKDGTYSRPYIRNSPNNTKIDNFSTKGNLNPYSGKKGTRK